jgi:quercetin dioxygenase-like cupin family protein
MVDAQEGPRMIVKRHNNDHFTRRFSNVSTSARMILPGRDGVRVKVTEFVAEGEDRFEDVSYPFDETVRIIAGSATILERSGRIHGVLPGDTYHVPAGESYSIYFMPGTRAVCFFSQAADGTLPDDK